MATAEDYNKAIRDLRAVQRRNGELETRHMGQVVRIEELMEAVETVNRAGVLKARALEARNAKLEAVRKAASDLKTAVELTGEFAQAQADLDDALAAAEEQDAKGT